MNYLSFIYGRFTIFILQYILQIFDKIFQKNKEEQLSIDYSLTINEKIIKTHQSFEFQKLPPRNLKPHMDKL